MSLTATPYSFYQYERGLLLHGFFNLIPQYRFKFACAHAQLKYVTFQYLSKSEGDHPPARVRLCANIKKGCTRLRRFDVLGD